MENRNRKAVKLLLHLLVAFFTLGYFIPAQVAIYRNHRQVWPIFILTFFTSWTVFGWIGALIWAVNTDVKQEEIASA